jgi:hypothetical protein
MAWVEIGGAAGAGDGFGDVVVVVLNMTAPAAITATAADIGRLVLLCAMVPS